MKYLITQCVVSHNVLNYFNKKLEFTFIEIISNLQMRIYLKIQKYNFILYISQKNNFLSNLSLIHYIKVRTKI